MCVAQDFGQCGSDTAGQCGQRYPCFASWLLSGPNKGDVHTSETHADKGGFMVPESTWFHSRGYPAFLSNCVFKKCLVLPEY